MCVRDEVGELPLDTQAKLLLALQPRKDGSYDVRSIGGKSYSTDARVILATNRDLDGAVRDGRFRDGLLARISAHVLRLPPLRERRHLALAAYLDALGEESELGGARFQLAQPAWARLVRFAFDPANDWRWNYRASRRSGAKFAWRTS